MTDDNKQAAAMAALAIWADVLEEEKKLWTCRYCGGRTSILSEVCDGCGVEDCGQGDLKWNPE